MSARHINPRGSTAARRSAKPSWSNSRRPEMLLLIALIGLIPIVGWGQIIGWSLACLDQRRRGQGELPEAGFRYFGRGKNLFLVGFVYFAVVYVVASLAPGGTYLFILLLPIQLVLPTITLATEHAVAAASSCRY